MDISTLLTEILKFPIFLSPELTLLNVGIDAFPSDYQYLVMHILLAARLVIVPHGKSPVTLSRSEAITLVHTFTVHMRGC